MTKRRGLTPEDRALWQKVMTGTNRLEKPGIPAQQKQQPTAKPPQAPPRELRNFPINGNDTIRPGGQNLRGTTRIDLADQMPKKVGRPEPGLDKRTAERLRRGDRAPEARLDLHGMTAERAHRSLNGFMARSLAQSLRCVLVITGKGGRHSSEDAPFMRSDLGVLRQAVPRWLKSGPYRGQIIGIFEAHPRHGGGGALYVYLKKAR